MQKVTHRKDGSNVRPKSSLEKAIRELEKMVAECKAINFLWQFYFLYMVICRVSCK